MKPSEIINQAFILLEFVLKLVCHAELGKINAADFNESVMVLLENRNLVFNHSAFNSTDEIVLAAQNCHTLALGFSAEALNTAIRTSGIAEANPDLRDFVYMIRCAFAHPDHMLQPRWEARGPRYAREFRLSLSSGPVIIDVRDFNGQPFDYQHIGGAERYFELKDEVLRLVAKKEQEGS